LSGRREVLPGSRRADEHYAIARRFSAREQISAQRFQRSAVQVADVGIKAHEFGGVIGLRRCRGRPQPRDIDALIAAACGARLLRGGLRRA
jgi:hypothetical protein